MKENISFGICADVHHDDKMPDSKERLAAFIRDMNAKKPDFIIHLGDFSPPNKSRQDFFDIWNLFNGFRYHVLGNHDRDNHDKNDNDGKRFDWDYVTSFYNRNGICPARQYSFDLKGNHFVILNTNDQRVDNVWTSSQGQGYYPEWIGPEQRAWLEQDLDSTDLPVCIFSHANLDFDYEEGWGIYESLRTRRILDRANEKAGWQKVRVCFSGHLHNDFENIINGIHYIQINSMSFSGWVEDPKYFVPRFDPWVYEKFPLCKKTIPYKGPLWAYVSISASGEVEIKGMKTEFLGPTELEMGLEPFIYPESPFISDRKFGFIR